METALVILLLSVIFILTIQACVDILQNKFLTKTERTNFLFIAIIFPVGGYLIYFLYYKGAEVDQLGTKAHSVLLILPMVVSNNPNENPFI